MRMNIGLLLLLLLYNEKNNALKQIGENNNVVLLNFNIVKRRRRKTMSVLFIFNQSKFNLKECMSSYKTTSGTEKKKRNYI
jgi:hypothetical protein